MQAWYLNSPFLIYLIIITCLDKSKSGAHVNYFFCQFIKWFTIQYYHLLLTPYLYSKVLSKTNQKTEMPEVEDPFISTVSHHSKRKIAYPCCKRSKVFKKAFFNRRKLGRPSSSFFFPTKRPRSRRQFAFNRKLPSDTFLKEFLIPLLRMHLKRRGTHDCLLLITLFIFESKLCLTFE